MSSASPAPTPQAPVLVVGGSRTRRISVRQAVRLAALLLLVVISLATPGFVATPSLYAMLTTIAYVGCVALGMTLITISGNIMSFCLAATTSATTIVFVLALNAAGLAGAIIAALAFGAVVTGLQGWIVGWFRANPIIVTIAALALVTGAVQALTHGLSFYPVSDSSLAPLKGRVLGMPLEFVLFLAALAATQLLLSLTIFGRNLFLVGDSIAAAEAAGILPWRTVTGAFLCAGILASVGGILLATRFSMGNMQYAQGYDYGAIAAVLVGGTAIEGGHGSVLRTLVGIAFITAVQVVLLLHGLSEQWQYFNLGAIVLAAILLQTARGAAAAPTKTLSGKGLPDPHLRPLALLAATIALLVLLDAGGGRILTVATGFSAFQTFATLGLVALGLGVTMIAGEFDLSVAGMFGMAGCIAVLTGATHPLLGIALAIAAGALAGLVQGGLILRLGLGSTSVTLGGLLLFIGVAYVLTNGRSVPYANLDVALWINAPIAGLFSVRSLVTLAIFLVVAAFIGGTRLGRDLVAIGSDRRAAVIAGVNVPVLILVSFAFSGAMAGISGAMLGYSLATASPSGLSDVLVPATAAAILGGVSLSGGVGRPLGIAIGVLTLSALRAGLNGIGASLAMDEIVTGALLLAVAVADGAATPRRLAALLPLRRTSRG